jgi:hypothetical protein
MAIYNFASGDIPIDRYNTQVQGQGDIGVTNAAGVLQIGAGIGGVLDAAAGTLQVSNDGVSWTAMLRGDTGAAVTALTATNVPVALNARFMRCTAGSASIRPLITTTVA